MSNFTTKARRVIRSGLRPQDRDAKLIELYYYLRGRWPRRVMKLQVRRDVQEDIDMERNTPVPVYIPAPGSFAAHTIAPGSGIVGRANDLGIVIYYEGNIYRAPGLSRYEDKLYHAWSRMSVKAPTTALMLVPPAQLIQVGEFLPATKQVTILDGQEEQVKAWKGASNG